MTFTERACYGAARERTAPVGPGDASVHDLARTQTTRHSSESDRGTGTHVTSRLVAGSGAEERGWERPEQGSVSASGRFAGRRVCPCTTSKRARTSSSRRRCSAPTSGASGRSRCRGCCASPRSTRSRPTSCCRASSKARSASSTRAARPALETGFTIDLVRLHDLDDPDAQILSRFATSIQLERQDFNGRMLTIRRSDLRVLASVHGPPHRRARRPARAARPPRRRASEPPGRASIRPEPPGPRATLSAPWQRRTPARRVKILVPGNHLMVGLLGQRDELLRLVEAAFPVQILVRGNEITITGDSTDTERVGRLFEEMVVLLEQGHELDRDEPRPLDRDAEGRPAPERGAHDRGRARPQDRPPEDRGPEALRRRGARQHDHVRRSARPAPARATSRSRSRCRRCRRRK